MLQIKVVWLSNKFNFMQGVIIFDGGTLILTLGEGWIIFCVSIKTSLESGEMHHASVRENWKERRQIGMLSGMDEWMSNVARNDWNARVYIHNPANQTVVPCLEEGSFTIFFQYKIIINVYFYNFQVYQVCPHFSQNSYNHIDKRFMSWDLSWSFAIFFWKVKIIFQKGCIDFVSFFITKCNLSLTPPLLIKIFFISFHFRSPSNPEISSPHRPESKFSIEKNANISINRMLY